MNREKEISIIRTNEFWNSHVTQLIIGLLAFTISAIYFSCTNGDYVEDNIKPEKIIEYTLIDIPEGMRVGAE